MMKYSIALLVGCFFGCSDTSVQEQPKPWFENEANKRGFDFIYESGFNGTPKYPEIFGGGAALLDVDGDGDLDVMLCKAVQYIIQFKERQQTNFF